MFIAETFHCIRCLNLGVLLSWCTIFAFDLEYYRTVTSVYMLHHAISRGQSQLIPWTLAVPQFSLKRIPWEVFSSELLYNYSTENLWAVAFASSLLNKHINKWNYKDFVLIFLTKQSLLWCCSHTRRGAFHRSVYFVF